MIAASLFAGPGMAAPAASQGSGTPEAEGFRLVARIPAEEWTALAEGFATATPVATPAAAGMEGELAGQELVQALRQGGYVIYLRHAATDFSKTDTDRVNLENCATQRNLSEEGRAQASAIGEAIRALGIPIGDVLSSEYCRTRETATLAFGRVEPTRDLTSRVSTANETEEAERIEALRRLLATPPDPGTNTVLVGHQFNLLDATGISIAEGEAAIFRS